METNGTQVSTCISASQYSVSERQMSEMGSRGEGVPFQPQSLTVVPLNIKWHPGTRSRHCSWHIIFGWNASMQWMHGWEWRGVWICLKISALFLEMSTPRGVMPHVGIQAPLVSLKQQVQVCPRSFICHSPIAGGTGCCGLWSKAPGRGFDWETPLMGSRFLLGLNGNSSLS